MIEWNIQSRAHACQGCGRGFRNEEPLHTLLFDERQSYQRVDVCEGCWTAQYSESANHRRGFISHWQGAYAPPPVAAPDPIEKETAETLLRKLVVLNDPQHAGACFILAIMLERKRLLKVKAQTTEAGRRVFLYEHPKSGDLFTIPDPNLQLDQLDAVQRDVAQLLGQGSSPQPDTAALAPAAGPIDESVSLSSAPPLAPTPPVSIEPAQDPPNEERKPAAGEAAEFAPAPSARGVDAPSPSPRPAAE